MPEKYKESAAFLYQSESLKNTTKSKLSCQAIRDIKKSNIKYTQNRIGDNSTMKEIAFFKKFTICRKKSPANRIIAEKANSI
ncbi:MAG: hypothetical protein ACLFSQ_10755 [Candidatus Zixiibacteriota bacterium]